MESWLKELNTEVTEIFHDLNLFKEIGSIVDKNQELKSMDPTALEWMQKSGVGNLVISIGRICDTSKKSKSLVTFLEKLKKNRSLYPSGLTDIEEDIKVLTKENPCKKILELRNNFVAHIGNKDIEPPTYDELFEGFQIIEKFMKKYNTEITDNYIVDFTPTIQGDWQQVFTIPWIKKDPN